MRLERLARLAWRHVQLAHGVAWGAAVQMARNHKQATAIEREALAAVDAIDDVLTERNATHLVALMATLAVAGRTAQRAVHASHEAGLEAFLRRRLQEEA